MNKLFYSPLRLFFIIFLLRKTLNLRGVTGCRRGGVEVRWGCNELFLGVKGCCGSVKGCCGDVFFWGWGGGGGGVINYVQVAWAGPYYDPRHPEWPASK